MKRILIALASTLTMMQAGAQNYQALHGSPYSGSLSNDFNPAAILNSPYTWDLTLFGVQSKTLTNAFNFTNTSLLHNPEVVMVNTKEGDFARNALASVDVHLFNGRLSLSRRSAIGFGLNLRNYLRTLAGPYAYADSILFTRDFLAVNEQNIPLGGNVVQASWLEAYGSYARVIYEDDGARLQGGVTLSLLRSMSGGYALMQDGAYIPTATGFQVTNVAAQYGYSNNYDHNPNLPTVADKLKEAVQAGHLGVSVSVGGEYVQKTGEDWGKEEKSSTDVYDWKLGVALLDVGVNKFRYGGNSAVAQGIKGVVTDATLEQKFHNINSLQQFNDSLKTVVAEFNTISGLFNINTPGRLLVNYDKRLDVLDGNCAVNAEFTLNFSGIHSTLANVQELNLLTVTPRWEKSALGGYLPIEVTNQGHFWVGAAIKAGPLLLGLHNLGWLFSKKSIPNGGGYLAIIIHPAPHEKDGVPCPKF